MIDAFHTAEPANDAAYKAWQAAGQRAVMRRDPDQRTAGPIPTFGSMVHETGLAARGLNYAPAGAESSNEDRPDIHYAGDADNSYGFHDVLDVLNPLQHIPILGTIYRNLTGDTIKPLSSIIGGGIFGGPIGAVSSTVNVCVKETTGRDIAENAMALAGFDSFASPAPRPQLRYETAMTPDSEPSKAPQFQAAADAYAQGGRKNFAALKPQIQSWNA